MKIQKNQKGVTLVEMMTVIVIIAILFIILMPNLSNAFDKAKVTGVKSDLKGYETSLMSYLMRSPGEEKTINKINKHIDRKFKFEAEGVSTRENPFDQPYELTVENNKFIVIKTTDDREKNKRVFTLIVKYINGEVESGYIGFDEDIDEDGTKEIIEKEKENVGDSEDDGTGEEVVPGEGDGGNGDGTNGTEETIDPAKLEKVLLTIDSSFYAKQHTITINTSGEELKAQNIEYAWSLNRDVPTTGFTPLTSNIVEKNDGDGEYFFHVRYNNEKDETYKYGNLSVKMDNTNPTVTLKNNGGTMAKEHSEEIVAEDTLSGVSTIKYIWSNSEVTPTSGYTSYYGGEIIKGGLDGGYYLYVEVIDIAGNKTTIKSNKYFFDSSNPMITMTPNEKLTWVTTQNVTVTATDEGSGVKELKYIQTNSETFPADNDEWLTSMSSTSLSKKIEGNGIQYLHVKAIDNANNEVRYSSGKYKIDSAVPIISIGTDGSNTWKLKQTTTVQATDSESGIDKIEYQWTTSSTFPTSGTFQTVNSGDEVYKKDGEGLYYLHIRAIDMAGNKKEKTTEVFKVDNVGPSINFSPNGNNNYLKKQNTIVGVTDSGSGYYKKYIMWKITNTTPSSADSAWIESTSEMFETTNNGSNYLFVKAIDALGNETITASAEFKVDTEAPTITLGTNGNSWAKTQSTSVTFNDNSGNVKTKQYVWSDSTSTPTSGWTNYTSGNISLSGITGTRYLHVKATDAAGNERVIRSNAFYFDNATPNLTLGSNGNSTASETHSSTFSSSDSNSGISSIQYQWSTSSTTPTSGWSTYNGTSGTITGSGLKGNYYLHVKATDVAGNVTNVRSSSVFVYKIIDVTPPTIEASGGIYETGTGPKVTVTDNGTIDSIKYFYSFTDYTMTQLQTGSYDSLFTKSIGNGAKATLNNEEVYERYTLYIRAADIDGNVTYLKVSVEFW